MSKVKMPEPVAFRWKAPIVDSVGRQCGESEWKIGMEKGGLPWWTQDNLITTDQAEAYADARVREELEATGGHRLVEPDHKTALALADAPRSLRNYVAALRSAIAAAPTPPAGRAVLQSQDREDAERLDWLDSMSARLNQHYGTQYQWELAVSPNIVRLMFGAGGDGRVATIDLNDSAANGVPSCREAIDRARRA